MPRSIRMLMLAGVVSGAIAAAPASAAADTTASPSSLDFGSVPVGTQSVTQVVTLTESCGLLDLNCLNGILPSQFSPVVSATTGFTQTNACPTTLLTSILPLPGLPVSCTIDVSFVPTALGQLTGLLRTGGGGPTVQLSGSGSTGSTGPIGSGGTPGKKTRKRKCKKHKANHRSLAAKKCRKRK